MTDEPALGPKMKALSERRRAFVLALLDTGGQNATHAAELAGYAADSRGSLWVQAHRLMHDGDVLAAIHEVSVERMRAYGLAMVSVVSEIALDPRSEDKDRLKAAGMVLDRIGLHGISEQRHVVDDHRSRTDLLAELVELIKATRAAPPMIEGKVVEADDAGR